MGRRDVILLDTHILVRYAAGDRKLGKRAIRSIDSALRKSELAVSAISFWEVAMLVEKRRLKLQSAPIAFRALALRQGIYEYPVDGEIAIRSAELTALHADPADRIIAATAISAGATLITADAQLLGAQLAGLRVQDGTR